MRNTDVKINGIIDKTISFIEDFQLMDVELWNKFANQFVSKPDGADQGWRGEFWGKMMRGACVTYKYTKNEQLYNILNNTVLHMLDMQEASGRISTYDIENEFTGWDMWCRKYVILGMEFFYDICKDDSLKEKILKSIRAQADYILSKVGPGKLDITKTAKYWQGLNSSSVLEPIMILHNITGEKRYLDFASYIVNRGGGDSCNIFELAYEGKLYPYQYDVQKAYEMISCFEGLLEYYKATGIEKWRTAVINFAHLLIESEVSIIGSMGCKSELFSNTKVNQTDAKIKEGHETCVTATWMKFCHKLIMLTKDMAFADEFELSLYNALLGAVNHEKSSNLNAWNTTPCKNNSKMAFDSYSPLINNTRCTCIGGYKDIDEDMYYGCCVSIGSVATGIIPEMSVMAEDNGTKFNLYLPGKVKTSDAEFEIKTSYPFDSEIDITVSTAEEKVFTLYLRIPEWSKKTILTINGENINVSCGNYTEINRVWKNGDKVVLCLDLTTKLIRPVGIFDNEYYVALKRGPVILARDARLESDITQCADIKTDQEDIIDIIPSNKATFSTNFECKVPLEDGGYIPMIDYASAGKTWDNKSLMTAFVRMNK